MGRLNNTLSLNIIFSTNSFLVLRRPSIDILGFRLELLLDNLLRFSSEGYLLLVIFLIVILPSFFHINYYVFIWVRHICVTVTLKLIFHNFLFYFALDILQIWRDGFLVILGLVTGTWMVMDFFLLLLRLFLGNLHSWRGMLLNYFLILVSIVRKLVFLSSVVLYLLGLLVVLSVIVSLCWRRREGLFFLLLRNYLLRFDPLVVFEHLVQFLSCFLHLFKPLVQGRFLLFAFYFLDAWFELCVWLSFLVRSVSPPRRVNHWIQRPRSLLILVR